MSKPVKPEAGPIAWRGYWHSTRVSDIGPLKGMPLTSLNCAQTPISDLSPLRGMPLTVPRGLA